MKVNVGRRIAAGLAQSSSKTIQRLAESIVLLRNQCLNSSVMTTSVASGSCTSRPDSLSSLQLAPPELI
jgi:hypothetical protein